MLKQFLNMSLLTLALISATANSETLAKDAIPEKITDQIYKKFPNAIINTAEQKKHFGQDLYSVRLKDGEENLIRYYKVNGNFFINGVKIDTSENANMLPPASSDNLKAAFSTYAIDDAIMVVNPNGNGEEFDLTITAEGVKWNVTLDKDGRIASKERN